MPVTGFYQTTNTNGHSLKELDIEMSLSALCARYFVDKGNTTKLNTENEKFDDFHIRSWMKCGI